MLEDAFDIHRIVAVAKDSPETLFNYLESLGKLNIANSILCFKMTGLCVDIFGSNTIDPKYSNFLKALRSKFGNDESIAHLDRDVHNFNILFSKVVESREVSGGVDQIDDEIKAPAFIIASDMVILGLSEIMGTQNAEELERKYPVLSELIVDWDFNNGTDMEELERVVESLCVYVPKILKYFKHIGVPFENLERKIPLDVLKKVTHYLLLFDKWSIILELYERWQLINDCNLVKEDNKEYRFCYDMELDIEYHTSVDRFENNRGSIMRDIALGQVNPDLVDANTRLLFPEKVISNEEFGDFLILYRVSEILPSESVFNVTMSEWVRANSLFRKMSAEVIENRDGEDSYSLSEWCICRTRDEIKDLLCNVGIREESAFTILQHLMFNKDSDDLMDCPLLQIGDKYLLFPSMQSINCGGQSLPSNFIRSRQDLHFKGKTFEESTRKQFVDVGINCEDISSKVGEDEYQCDGTFVLEDNLFFIECKAFIQPRYLKQYIEFLWKIHDAVSQLDRIAKYYSNSLELVRNKLSLPEDWQPKEITNIVIVKPMLGKNLKHNETYIVDDSSLSKVLTRNQASFTKDGKDIFTQELYDENLDAELTLARFVGFLTTSRHIEWTRDNFRPVNVDQQIGDTTLKFQDLAKERARYIV